MREGSLGHLFIDGDNGTAEFRDSHDCVKLRITHLPTPIPTNVMIDLVAIRNVTSYTPITRSEDASLRTTKTRPSTRGKATGPYQGYAVPSNSALHGHRSRQAVITHAATRGCGIS